MLSRTQDLIACLALLGSSLASLCFVASSNLLTSSTLRNIWVAPRLKSLVLRLCNFPIDDDDFAVGMVELKCVLPSSCCFGGQHAWAQECPCVRIPETAT